MNVLVTCHKPPGFGHEEVFQLNTNTYKAHRASKTRKNARQNVTAKGDTIYYIDTKEKGVPKKTPNWFSRWKNVPDNSMDLIWCHNCPLFGPFTIDELYPKLMFEEREDASFLTEGGDFWIDIITHGKRILKTHGKIVFPFPQTREDWVTDHIQIALIARILNMEVAPDYLYKISVIDSLSERHTSYLKNAFILNSRNFDRKKNGTEKVMDLGEAFVFLILEKS
jgi:hypothetical protein